VWLLLEETHLVTSSWRWTARSWCISSASKRCAPPDRSRDGERAPQALISRSAGRFTTHSLIRDAPQFFFNEISSKFLLRFIFSWNFFPKNLFYKKYFYNFLQNYEIFQNFIFPKKHEKSSFFGLFWPCRQAAGGPIPANSFIREI